MTQPPPERGKGGELKITVETHSGYKADEYPTAFFLDEHRHEVVEVEDRWYGPGYSYFKVFADDGKRYMLKHNSEQGGWEVKCMERGPGDA